MRSFALARIGLAIVPLLCPFSAHALTNIDTCAELENMSGNVSETYVMTADIDCTGVDFDPVGTYGARFTGTLNGGNHTISNLNINTSTGAGLFAFANGATIRNVIIDDARIHARNHSEEYGVGGIVGFAINTSIENVGVTNSVITRSGAYVGGIAGAIIGSMTGAYVTNSTIVSQGGGGGLAGYLLGGTISNSYAVANIYDSGDGSGGAVGAIFAFTSAKLQNVYASGSLVSTGAYQGGLIGAISQMGGVSCDVHNSFAAGAVSGPSAASLVAVKLDDSCSITNSYVLDHANNPDECMGIDDGGTTECAEVPADFFYYFQFSGVPPLSSWDFDDVWTERYLSAPGLQWGDARPDPVTSLAATASANDVLLTWSNPADSDFDSVVILRSTSSFSTTVNLPGAVSSRVTGTNQTDSDLEDGTYYYSTFVLDEAGNVSAVSNATVTVNTASSSAGGGGIPSFLQNLRTANGLDRWGYPIMSSSSASSVSSVSSASSIAEAAASLTSEGSSSSSPSSSSSIFPVPVHPAASMTLFEHRTCARVMKWFSGNQKMLDRVNARLEKRFGFMCTE